MLRRVGLAAIQRELDRTARSGEGLVVAYIDVDGLKRVNDTAGHTAGDALLGDVARSITHHLRSYDVMCRFGGDEFLCSLAGQNAEGARARFEEIGTQLSASAKGPPSPSVSLNGRRTTRSRTWSPGPTRSWSRRAGASEA